MREIVYEAFIFGGHHCCGRELVPLAAGHLLMLEAVECDLALAALGLGAEGQAAAGDSGRYPMEQLVLAAKICSARSRCADDLAFAAADEMWLERLMDAGERERETARFLAYVEDYWVFFRQWNFADEGRGVAVSGHWLLARVVSAAKAFGRDPAEVWWWPVGELLCYDQQLEALSGGRRIVDPEEDDAVDAELAEAEAELERMAAERGLRVVEEDGVRRLVAEEEVSHGGAETGRRGEDED